MPRLSLNLPEKSLKLLQEIAEANETTATQIIREAIALRKWADEGDGEEDYLAIVDKEDKVKRRAPYLKP